MYGDRTKLIVCFVVLLAMSGFLGVRAWKDRIQTFQGVVTTSILYVPEDAGTGILLQMPAGGIELEWESPSKHRQMAEELDGKTVVVSGYFRKGTSTFSRRIRLRVISLQVISPAGTTQPGMRPSQLDRIS